MNKTPLRTLDVIGVMNLNQTASLNNVFINGGLITASGNRNIAIGGSTTLDAITTADDNIAIGSASLGAITTGARNIGIGSSVGGFWNDENDNIAIGYSAGQNSGGDASVFIGRITGFSHSDADSSVFIGYEAGRGTGSNNGRKNVVIGAKAAYQVTGDGNVFIGYNVLTGTGGLNNSLAIDNSNTATPLIRGDFNADSLRFNGIVSVKNRFKISQGADVASVAGTITLGSDGNVFEITGTNSIDRIASTGWTNGNEITLIFTDAATLVDGTANSGSQIGMELAGNGNFGASADDVVKLVLCEIGGTQRWREVSRSAN